MHILLVEDDPMIGEAVREALTDEGYDVLWAKSGWEAGGMLAAGTFDVVCFLIWGCPAATGWRFCGTCGPRIRQRRFW